MGPTKAFINHVNIRQNIALIRKAVGVKRRIMAVVKANAYGHGDIEVSRTALDSGCESLGVAFVEEGLKLRKTGISDPILVFGAHTIDDLQRAIEHDLEITITNTKQMEFLEQTSLKKRVRIHIKFDTGMNRVGFDYRTASDVVKRLVELPNVAIEGIYSHLATSDEADKSYTQLQIKRFSELKESIRPYTADNVQFHLANSGGIMAHPDSYFDMVRPGIMLYGQPPSPDFKTDWPLLEAMALQSQLGLIKLIAKNEPISYGRRYYTDQEIYIGVIPLGYADGFDRKNTNRSFVLINGKRYPLVGTVCMDMVMVNLGTKTDCHIGDTVIIYGNGLSITEVAKRLETIPYEITCRVSPRVQRIHMYE